MRQKFHEIRWRVSFGGDLAIGPRLGSQPLVFDVVLMGRRWQDLGGFGVGVDADWRAYSAALLYPQPAASRFRFRFRWWEDGR